MKRILLAAILGLTFSGITQAQSERCTAEIKHQERLQNDPAYAAQMRVNESDLQQLIQNRTIASTTVVKVPVVVHVMHLGETEGTGTNISDEQIQSAIDNLTAAYRNEAPYTGVDTYIEFELAGLDPDCNPTNGINRINASGISNYITSGITDANENSVKDLSRWSNDSYYNIWIVTEIEGNNAGSGTQGYAYYPGGSSDLDGAVVLYNAFGYDPDGSLGYNVKSWTAHNITAIHEVGHSMNVRHTFNDDNSGASCPPDNDCSTDGDMVCDTDPHIRPSSGCADEANACTGGTMGTLMNNFMNYTDDDCQTMFTAGQGDRIRATIEGIRASLISSRAFDTLAPAFSAPIATSCSPQTGSVGLSGGYGGIMSVEMGSFIGNSSHAGNDGGYMDFGGECMNVIRLDAGELVDFTISTWYNDHSVEMWLDYDNDGTFDNVSETIFSGTTPAAPASPYLGTTSGTFTVPSQGIAYDQYIRMRVSADTSPLTDACSAPDYGQVEDYVVYISSEFATFNKMAVAFGTLDFFPNPATDQLRFVAPEAGQMQILTVDGKLVIDRNVRAGDSSLDISDLENGMYLIQFNGTTTHTKDKLIVGKQ